MAESTSEPFPETRHCRGDLRHETTERLKHPCPKQADITAATALTPLVYEFTQGVEV